VDYHIFKSMVNGVFGPFVGWNRRPNFMDVRKTYPALDTLTKGYPVIRGEFDRLMAEWATLPEYHDIDSGERKISGTTPKKWSVFVLEILGHKPAINRECCPETCKLLDEIPGLIQAFFSVLDPGKSVPEHEGPYLGYLRYHLGLQVPKVKPPKLVVKGQDYHWHEGEGVLFDDSYPHAVVNDSPETRAVLIVDVRRPLPFPVNLLNRFVTNVVARHTYGRKVAKKAEEFAAQAERIVRRRQAA
jgi:aspartyl/asparaginyl beta-hydroxylase (cupin superfamily)